MKYLAVDLGNVICEVDLNPFSEKLSYILDIDIEYVNEFLIKTTKLHDLGLTCMADELKNYFKTIVLNAFSIANKPDTIDELIECWNRAIVGNTYMLKFLSDLLQEGETQIALLSNIGIEHASLMRKTLTENVFDNSIKFFSCEVGARKPSLLYYKTFLDMYPNFNGCLYLDDRIENIEASKKFNFNAVQFELNKIGADDIGSKILEFKCLLEKEKQ